ncbi:MAG: hypothetical protein M1542_09470 [Thermotogae bacterium]|nr:hypothetical protein [Thermotogota bacterium]MCL5033455.1 hypothetical protein [Thermotogota bacterium]
MQNTKNLRKKLKDSIDNLSDDEIKRLWEEYEELIIERELNKDPNFFKDAKDALNGVNIVSNEEVKRQLNL